MGTKKAKNKVEPAKLNVTQVLRKLRPILPEGFSRTKEKQRFVYTDGNVLLELVYYCNLPSRDAAKERECFPTSIRLSVGSSYRSATLRTRTFQRGRTSGEFNYETVASAATQYRLRVAQIKQSNAEAAVRKAGDKARSEEIARSIASKTRIPALKGPGDYWGRHAKLKNGIKVVVEIQVSTDSAGDRSECVELSLKNMTPEKAAAILLYAKSLDGPALPDPDETPSRPRHRSRR